MISVLLTLSLLLSVQCNNTVYSFNQSIDSDSLSLTYTGNDMALVYYEINTTQITASTFFQWINLTSGVVTQNFTGASGIENLIWINNTQNFIATYTQNGSEMLGIWNFSSKTPINSYEIVKYSVGGDGNFFETPLFQSTEYVLSGEYIFNSTGAMFVQLEVLSLKTGDQVYVDQDAKMNFIMGVTASANRYTYIGLSGGFEETRISHLKCIDPKKKSIVINKQIVQSEGYLSPHFYSISEFQSLNHGNLLGVTVSNQTFFVMDTLTGEIVSTMQLDFEEHLTPVCRTINDEVDVLFYCIAEASTIIKVYKGKTKPVLIASIVETEEVFAFTSQPEKQQLLYCTSKAIKQWSYATNQTQIII